MSCVPLHESKTQFSHNSSTETTYEKLCSAIENIALLRQQYTRARVSIPCSATAERMLQDRHLESTKLPYRFHKVYYAINASYIAPFIDSVTEAGIGQNETTCFQPWNDVSTWNNDNESSPFRNALMWRGWESFLTNLRKQMLGAF